MINAPFFAAQKKIAGSLRLLTGLSVDNNLVQINHSPLEVS
jgi:hypothetical protein